MAKNETSDVRMNKFHSMGDGKYWFMGFVVVAIFILIFLAGLAIGNNHRSIDRVGFVGGYGMGMHREGFDGVRGSGINSLSNGQERVSGVVTSTSGNGFTVAANGSTTKVTTSSSTSYQGGNQVKQNDSVIVVGTMSNNTLDATNIVINP